MRSAIGVSNLLTVNRIETPWGPWEVASLSEVAAVFSRAPVSWWIAGGYAIELAVGDAFRQHEDIDVLLLRRDQLTVQEVLPAWERWAADPPSRWHMAAVRGPHVSDCPAQLVVVYCRAGAGWSAPDVARATQRPLSLVIRTGWAKQSLISSLVST